ncbi:MULTISPECIES: 4'-phosphopantetheinyl transferase superfamily protein [unclassified Lysinibacillus]|uniref:4'-phosphopantetheinyl transferase family protein n=1 Tax=unclassified Lysinibacillus TaxID=2636778 RepID=UPI0006ABC69D|nr:MULTISPECIES: 4'-phosphopantetheinyl transferase superfamily protein [unclassified Lysinibacillus]KOP70463.1 hypothetical protein AMS59_19720 [Lysinibacillus sp. FJAT-14745]MDM5249177.1 4'-phosphopantetheinyl transferase superfamily protein [Lysinibacillus sp. G4S2]
MIYYFDSIDLFTQEICNKMIEKLPYERQQKVLHYKRLVDKKLSIISYLLLMYGLKNEYAFSQTINFGYQENQKPYLLNNPHIQFNISHCDYCVVVAISKREIGIDVQDFIEYDQKLAEVVCSKEELDTLNRSNCPEIVFTRYWTLKESYLKMTGEGISEDMIHIDFSSQSEMTFEKYHSYFQLFHNKNYIISSCSLEPNMKINRLSLIDLIQ